MANCFPYTAKKKMDFDSAPVYSLLKDTLKQYNNAIQSLLESLASLNPQADVARSRGQRLSLTANIIQLDKRLQKIYHLIKDHQERQKQIKETQEKIIECDLLKRNLASQLFETKDGLEHSLADAKERVETTNTVKQSKLNYNNIIHYANRLSAFTSAPPNFSTSQQYVGNYELPYPVEVAMHASILNQLPAILSKKTNDAQDEEAKDGFSHKEHDFQFGDLDDEDILDLVLNPDLD